MKRRGESGQTTTEFLMISGLMTAVTILVLNYMYGPLRPRVQEIVNYIIDGVADPPW